ncbi:universal stress protein [Roseibium sp. RKSG952]|uniref:universal stress protein n=1 Tax=Roseibium sp. RKSG952 TaxID=2529384 RepID=UPI0012BC892F|nr:universal stress protein [Roseibium sp. RKSG952]MTH97810.1 universal stress protein [Roseibium sp. RKSG952]
MFKTILVPIDPAEPAFSKDALDKARQFSRDYDAKVLLLAVCPEVQSFVTSQLPEGFQEHELEETRTMLNGLRDKLDLGGSVVQVEARIGAVDAEVLEFAARHAVDLIVMTSHKPGFSTYFVGSHAAHIVRHAPCSVMVLRGD